jgi:hypothetical protein
MILQRGLYMGLAGCGVVVIVLLCTEYDRGAGRDSVWSKTS